MPIFLTEFLLRLAYDSYFQAYSNGHSKDKGFIVVPALPIVLLALSLRGIHTMFMFPGH